jgi:hypothetical protein
MWSADNLDKILADDTIYHSECQAMDSKKFIESSSFEIFFEPYGFAGLIL